MNCIKIGLPGKLIPRDYFQENMTSQRPFLLLTIIFPGRPIFIQLPPGHLLQKVNFICKSILVAIVLEERPFLPAVSRPWPSSVVAAAEPVRLRRRRRPEGQVRHGGLRLQPGEETGAAVRQGDKLRTGKEGVQLSVVERVRGGRILLDICCTNVIKEDEVK